MSNQKSILRLHIDGRWRADELSRTISSINTFYKIIYATNKLKYNPYQNLEANPALYTRLIRDNHNKAWSMLYKIYGEIKERSEYGADYKIIPTTEDMYKRWKEILSNKSFIPELIEQYCPEINFNGNTESAQKLEIRIKQALDEFMSESILELAEISDKSNIELVQFIRKNTPKVMSSSQVVVKKAIDKIESVFNELPLSAYDGLIIDGSRIFPQEDELSVVSIKYGSPGITDLLGLGEIFGHIKESVFNVVDLIVMRENRSLVDERISLENEHQRLKNQELALNNTKKFIGILRKGGLHKKETLFFVEKLLEPQLNDFVRLVKEGKLKSIEILPYDEDKVKGPPK